MTEELQVEEPKNMERSSFLKKVLIVTGAISFLIAVSVIAAVAFQRAKSTDSVSSQPSASAASGQSSQLSSVLQTQPLKDRMFYFNVGQKNDMEVCNGQSMKRTFPDLDYAMLGYNVLKGYPLAIGHDPGFTFPIFTSDYSKEIYTSDCRYLLPTGLVLIPDVACITSFSSKIIQTKLELSKSLSVSVSAQGGGWGAQFSASAGFKQAMSSISTSEYTYIISTANCRYYYSEIDEMNPPALSSSFMKWAKILNDTNTDNEKEYFRFFDHFGTHFLSGAVFGARFTYVSKMESTKFETMASSGVNVAVSASYSGVVSAGGGFNLDTEQRQAASNFQKNVETSTITIGAPPPANGDALTWASTVKDTPVPIEYKLSSIEHLFSNTYLRDSSINMTKISDSIKRYKPKYCAYLRDNALTDNCNAVDSQGILLRKSGLTRLSYDGKPTDIRPRFAAFSADRVTCLLECLERETCVAVEYCVLCNNKSPHYLRCYMYAENEMAKVRGVNKSDFETWILPTVISKYFKLHHTAILGTYIETGKTQRAENMEECMRWCFQYVECVAFTYCECPDGESIQTCRCYKKSINCKLFSFEWTSKLMVEKYTDAYFLSNKVKSVNETMQG